MPARRRGAGGHGHPPAHRPRRRLLLRVRPAAAPRGARRAAAEPGALLAVGGLAIVVVIVGLPRALRRERRHLPPRTEGSGPARARRPGAGRRRARGERHRHRAHARLQSAASRSTSTRSLTPLHRGHDRADQGAVADERRQPLRGAHAGSQQPAGAGRGSDAAGQRRAEVVDLDQLFNTLNPQTRKGLQQFIQGSAEQYAGAEPALGKATEYFAAVARRDRSLLRPSSPATSARSRTSSCESAKALTTLARAPRIAERAWSNNGDQTFQAIGSQQSSLAAGAAPAAGDAERRATGRSPSCPPTFDGAAPTS